MDRTWYSFDKFKEYPQSAVFAVQYIFRHIEFLAWKNIWVIMKLYDLCKSPKNSWMNHCFAPDDQIECIWLNVYVF
jgi:hypothetical protein